MTFNIFVLDLGAYYEIRNGAREICTFNKDEFLRSTIDKFASILKEQMTNAYFNGIVDAEVDVDSSYDE